MNTHGTMRRAAAALVVTALMVLAAPAMAEPNPAEPRGWERTSSATGRPDGGQLDQPTAGVQPSRPGWESTSVTTGDSPSVAGADQPVTPTSAMSLSTTLLYLIGLLAAATVAVMAARLMRPQGRPRGVA